MVTTLNTPVTVEGHKVVVKQETKETKVNVEGHNVKVNEILKETVVPVVGHGVRVAEELVVTQAHVAEHRVKPVVETVTTEIQVAKPDFTLKEVREQQEIVIKIPEPHLVLKKIPYDLEVELPRPPQQPKRDIITQTGGDEPPSPGSAADDALTDAEEVGSYSEEECPRESDPLIVFTRYGDPGRGSDENSDDAEEEDSDDDDGWNETEAPKRTMLQQLKEIEQPRDARRFIMRWSRRPFPTDLDETDNIIYTCWAKRQWRQAGPWPCPHCQETSDQTSTALDRHMESRHSERLPKDLLGETLASIHGRRSFWKLESERRESTTQRLFQCPLTKCGYFSSSKSGYCSHLMRQHPTCYELVARLGPLWGVLVYEARTNNVIITWSTARKDVKGYECPKCKCYRGQSKKTISTHCSRVHAETRVEGTRTRATEFHAAFSLSLEQGEYERLVRRVDSDEREDTERRRIVKEVRQETRHNPVIPPQEENNDERERRRAREDELRRRRAADTRISQILDDRQTHISDSSSASERQSRSQTQEENLRPLPDVIGRARQ